MPSPNQPTWYDTHKSYEAPMTPDTAPTPQEPSSISGGGPFPAVFTMHCPAGATNACVKHARGIDNLFGRMFGLRIQATRAPEGSQCDNCVNEAKTSEAAP